MTTEAQTAKKTLRKEIKSRLSALSADDIATQSAHAQQTVINLDQYKQAKSLSIYLSMPASEAQTDLLVRHALKEGKKVFVPFLYTPMLNETTDSKPRKVMDMLRLESEAEYEGLNKDAWGIPSLNADGVQNRENAMGGAGLTLVAEEGADRENAGDLGGLDLVVVPAVAFDSHMDRLGHGAGFYDAFLTRFCKDAKRARPHLVGLCLAEQILWQDHKIPTADWDWKVDVVAVGDGSLLS